MLPVQVGGAPVPDEDDTTICEVSCRLVGRRDAEKTGCTKGMDVPPSVELNMEAIDAALAPCVPVVEVEARRPPVPAAADADDSAGGRRAASASGIDGGSGALQLLLAGAQCVLSSLGLPGVLQPAPAPAPPSLLAWHQNKQTLAVGHASSGAVLLYEIGTAEAAAGAGRAGGVPCCSQPQQVLSHQLQRQVSCLAWRPVHCSMLAVGCEGGAALWSLGKLPLSAPSVTRGCWGNGGAAGGARQGGGWVSFLPFKQGCRVTSLSWSPDGRLLAGASADTNRLVVWDAALGVGAALRLGLSPTTCLSWSPDGNYLFAAGRSGRFFLYETTSWSLRSWDSPPGAAVTAAAWAPDSSVVLLALSGSTYLVALHLVGQPPALTEQLLPVVLPGVSDAQQPEQQQAGRPARSCIRGLAWDPTGGRLAVSLGEPHPAAGTVALFSTSFAPVVSCHLIGFVQPGGGGGGSGSGAGSAPSAAAELQLAFAAAPGKAGALLSVGRPGRGAALGLVRNVPLYF